MARNDAKEGARLRKPRIDGSQNYLGSVFPDSLDVGPDFCLLGGNP